MYEVELIPILAAAVANIILGFVWYHPKVLGSTWMRLANISPMQAEAGKKKMPMMAVVAFIAAGVMAYVTAHFKFAWGVYDIVGAVELGFWIWVGFIAVPLLGIVLWEGKSVKLYAINAGYWLIAMIVTCVILTL